MLIWLGKQMLGQRDNAAVAIAVRPERWRGAERACSIAGERSDRGREGLPEVHVWGLMLSSRTRDLEVIDFAVDLSSMTPQRRRCFVTAKQIAVKKYMVKLSGEERV